MALQYSFQDILGQLPVLKSYTHILLCFSLPNTRRDTVVASLESATERLLAAFPFLTGEVIHRDLHSGHSGCFTVEPRCNDENVEERRRRVLCVRDLSNEFPPYSLLCAAHAPSAMLPGSLLAPPRPAFPKTYSDEDGAPVLEMQAVLVHGGLLLDIAAQHNIIDATGIFHIAHLLSCIMDDHPDPIPEADILLGNCDRRNLIPLLGPEEPLPDYLAALTPTVRPPRLDVDTLDQFKWYWLHFAPEAIVHIHHEANSRPQDFVPPVTSVSVNDALTAFCWQCITLARSSVPQNQRPGEKVSEGRTRTAQISRAADLRRTMDLTPAYMGHMVRTANLRLPVHEITRGSLSNLASKLRVCVQEHTTLHAVRAYATLVARESDKRRISYAGSFDPRTDFSCSSVAHLKLPSFGELGRPDCVRRPTFGPLPGGMYIGPGWGGEGLDAVVCLMESEMESLRRNERWSSMVEFVG